jgi:hypothetical protein
LVTLVVVGLVLLLELVVPPFALFDLVLLP